MGAFAYVLGNSHSADSGLAVQDGTGAVIRSPYQNSSNGPSLVLNETPDADSQVPVNRRTADHSADCSQGKAFCSGIVTYTKESGLKAAGEGSGIIMTSDGYIITNAHVIDEASAVKVVMENGSEARRLLWAPTPKPTLRLLRLKKKT